MAADPARHAGGPGDRAAGVRVHRLFEEHSRMVYGLCRALLRDTHDAEDATQATFVSAYRAILGGSEPREPAAWLATIARNECTSRAQARMREPLPLADADVDAGHTPGPETELERRAVVSELRVAIEALPEKQREAVVLRDLYGLHYTEIGAALGMSVASVESLLFRARRSLRVSLKPLATGALTVPVAVREGVAQAVPLFGGTGAVAGGGAGGVMGLGVLAKLAAGPAGAQVAAGVAAALAAGSVAVAKVEHERRAPTDPARAAAPVEVVPGVVRSAAPTTRAAGAERVEGRQHEAPDATSMRLRAAGATTAPPDGGAGSGGSEMPASSAPAAAASVSSATEPSGTGSSGQGLSGSGGPGSRGSGSSGHGGGEAPGSDDETLESSSSGKSSEDSLSEKDDHAGSDDSGSGSSGSGSGGSRGSGSSDDRSTSGSGGGSGHDLESGSGGGDDGENEHSESNHSGSGSDEDDDRVTATASPL